MKWNKIIGILAIGTVFIFAGCKKVLDINEDPNNPSVSQATPLLLFPAVQLSAASAIGGELAIIGMLWSEYTTEDVSSSQYRNFDSYNVTSSDLSTAECKCSRRRCETASAENRRSRPRVLPSKARLVPWRGPT